MWILSRRSIQFSIFYETQKDKLDWFIYGHFFREQKSRLKYFVISIESRINLFIIQNKPTAYSKTIYEQSLIVSSISYIENPLNYSSFSYNPILSSKNSEK